MTVQRRILTIPANGVSERVAISGWNLSVLQAPQITDYALAPTLHFNTPNGDGFPVIRNLFVDSCRLFNSLYIRGNGESEGETIELMVASNPCYVPTIPQTGGGEAIPPPNAVIVAVTQGATGLYTIRFDTPNVFTPSPAGSSSGMAYDRKRNWLYSLGLGEINRSRPDGSGLEVFSVETLANGNADYVRITISPDCSKMAVAVEGDETTDGGFIVFDLATETVVAKASQAASTHKRGPYNISSDNDFVYVVAHTSFTTDRSSLIRYTWGGVFDLLMLVTAQYSGNDARWRSCAVDGTYAYACNGNQIFRILKNVVVGEATDGTITDSHVWADNGAATHDVTDMHADTDGGYLWIATGVAGGGAIGDGTVQGIPLSGVGARIILATEADPNFGDVTSMALMRV